MFQGTVHTHVHISAETADVLLLLSDDLLESVSVGFGKASTLERIIIVGSDDCLVEVDFEVL